MNTTTEQIERLAEASGLSAEQVQEKLADGFLFFREQDYWGAEQPPGEWLDAKPTEVVVNGTGQGYGGHWGRGPDIETAKREFRKHGGVLSNGYQVLTFGPGSVFIGIGGMGYRYLGDPPTTTEVEPRGKR